MSTELTPAPPSSSNNPNVSSIPFNRPITIGSRNSKLALIQTEIVRSQLLTHFPDIDFRIHSMTTTGDNNLNKPLYSFGAKSLWTRELEELLLDGKVDLIVHSLKDMPTQLPFGCRIGAILEREDPRDAVVMKAGSPYMHISQLPAGSVVGTSSVRRSAQLTRAFPNLHFQDVRGNIGTRLSKLDSSDTPYSCLILASAGLLRLDLGSRITHYLSSPTVLHAVGQGALGVETRTNDPEIDNLVKVLIHKPTYLKCLAERSLMRTLEGGCSVPIGVETEFVNSEMQEIVGGDGGGDGAESGYMRMRATVVALDGREAATVEAVSKDVVEDNDGADEFGRLVARKLVEGGAESILKKITLSRELVDA
ncbi:porphobilinogen deaminase, dipyromethane cofactor binding domain-containing protein [Kalaharituber pfeilii]|nr:porphobilinogen deaminase, dipyromethane cofactor binding domain-containing protein [Kalaharituber pfeilii]